MLPKVGRIGLEQTIDARMVDWSMGHPASILGGRVLSTRDSQNSGVLHLLLVIGLEGCLLTAESLSMLFFLFGSRVFHNSDL